MNGFVGALSIELFDIDWYWWVVLTGVMLVAWSLVKKDCKIKRIQETLLIGYIVLILIVTFFNRCYSEMTPQLRLFWSYGKPELVNEVILNYVLFVPLGVLLDYNIEERHIFFKSWIFATIMSLSIEVLQLIFSRGLFEFDDVIGNSLGCLLGTVGACYLRKFTRWISAHS